MNQNRSLTAVSPSGLFEEAKVRSAMEDMVLAIVEPCAPKFDGSVANAGAKEAKHEPLLLPIGVQAAITRCHT